MSERAICATVALSLLPLGWLAATAGAAPVLLLAFTLAAMLLLARRFHAASRHQAQLADLLATTRTARPRLRLVGTPVAATHGGRIQ